MTRSEYLRIGDWIMRVRQPESFSPNEIAFLIHGWQGDENVMWIFADRLPKNVLMIAPRAPYPAPKGGYSWVQSAAGEFSTEQDCDPARNALESLAEELGHRFGTDFQHRHLVGFSQGAAMCYAWAALYPDRVRTLAALAGFMPGGIEDDFFPGSMQGRRVFIGHGTEDRTVPVEMAQRGANVLETAGAGVQLCLDDVGHKLGSACMRALGSFYGQD